MYHFIIFILYIEKSNSPNSTVSYMNVLLSVFAILNKIQSSVLRKRGDYTYIMTDPDTNTGNVQQIMRQKN